MPLRWCQTNMISSSSYWEFIDLVYANPNFRLSDYGSSMTFMASLGPRKFNLISKLEICVEIIQREWDRAMDRMRNGLPAAISRESFADLNDFAFLFGLEMRNPVMDMVIQNIGRLNVSPLAE